MAGVEDPRVLVSSLPAAVALAARAKEAHTWEIAPVDRVSGGQRRWWGLAGSEASGYVWAPIARGGQRPPVTMTAEQVAKLPPLPTAAAGFWALHFLSEKLEVIDLDVVIDPRHREGAAPSATPPPPPVPPPPPAYTPASELTQELLSHARLTMDREQRAFSLALSAMETTTRLTQQAAEGAIQNAQSIQSLAAGYVAENATLRKKVDELSEANGTLTGHVAQLENESAGFKMLSDIYSGPGGAKEFSETVLTLGQAFLEQLSGGNKGSNKAE